MIVFPPETCLLSFLRGLNAWKELQFLRSVITLFWLHWHRTWLASSGFTSLVSAFVSFASLGSLGASFPSFGLPASFPASFGTSSFGSFSVGFFWQGSTHAPSLEIEGLDYSHKVPIVPSHMATILTGPQSPRLPLWGIPVRNKCKILGLQQLEETSSEIKVEPHRWPRPPDQRRETQFPVREGKAFFTDSMRIEDTSKRMLYVYINQPGILQQDEEFEKPTWSKKNKHT